MTENKQSKGSARKAYNKRRRTSTETRLNSMKKEGLECLEGLEFLEFLEFLENWISLEGLEFLEFLLD